MPFVPLQEGNELPAVINSQQIVAFNQTESTPGNVDVHIIMVRPEADVLVKNIPKENVNRLISDIISENNTTQIQPAPKQIVATRYKPDEPVL